VSTSMHDTNAEDLSTRTGIDPYASVALLDDEQLEALAAAVRNAQERRTVVTLRDRPAWSDPALDVTDLGNADPRDDLVWVKGIIDEWSVEEPSYSFPDKVLRRACTVYLEGVRHIEGPERDWPDVVRVDLASDGTEGDTIQGPEDVRRLATALARAADLLEGKE
jgi:hypothetical protein